MNDFVCTLRKRAGHQKERAWRVAAPSLLIVKVPGGVCNITQINNQTHKQYVAANQQSQTIQSLSIIINCLPYEDQVLMRVCND